jgi:transcriptional regulator with XRE-family HTH domain
MSEKRFNNYLNDKREPDFQTLLSICQRLGIPPAEVLTPGTYPHTGHKNVTAVPPSPDLVQNNTVGVIQTGSDDMHNARIELATLILTTVPDDQIDAILKLIKAPVVATVHPTQRGQN